MMMRPILRCCAALMMAVLASTTVFGFDDGGTIEVTDKVKSIELVAGASQPLKFPFPFPKMMVQIPEIIDANPISTTEILVTGLKPGVSSLTVVDAEGRHHTVTIEVKIDVRILQRTLDRLFPDSTVSVGALRNSVILSGYVSESGHVANMVAVAKDYFPVNVINDLKITKSQNVAIKVKVYEVSRTKLRSVGVDWSYFGENFNVVSSISELIASVGAGGSQATGDTLAFGVVGNNSNFQVFIQALEKHNLAKLLDEPTLVAKDGRPAEFLSGGEIPIQVASGLGTNSIEFRPFGTKLDLVPIIHGQGRMTLEVRAEVSELDNSLSGDTNVPGFRVRRVNTGVEMTAGHTLALAGDYREDLETEKQGLPKIMDHPIWGAAFRRITEQKNETELVFLITPRFIGEVEASQMPPVGIGRHSDSPSDKELYIDSYMEVPRCNDDCPVYDGFNAPANQQPGFQPGVLYQAPPSAEPQSGAPNNDFQGNIVPGSTTGQGATYDFRSGNSGTSPVGGTTVQFRSPASDYATPPSRQGESGFAWPSAPQGR